MSQEENGTRLLRQPTVLERVGFSKSELHRRINAGTFPKPIKIGIRAVAWTSSSIDEWINALVQDAK